MTLNNHFNSLGEIGQTDFLLTSPEGKEYLGDEILPLLKVSKSPQGIWGYFLFANSRRYLPVYWHGGYLRWSLILEPDDLDQIPILSDAPKDIMKHKVVAPSVFFRGDSVFIKYTYWSDWKGLVRQTDEATFIDGHISNLNFDLIEILVEYYGGPV